MRYNLLPHQQRAVDKLSADDLRALLLYHGLGSGKTLTSIAAKDQLGLPADVIVPASLRENYKKELLTHLGHIPKDMMIRSYNRAMKHPDEGPRGITIVDEGHNLGRPDSQRSSLFQRLPEAEKLLIMTGSPIRNHPSELAPLINALHGKHVVSRQPTEFSRQFITKTKEYPGIVNVLRGVKPGVVENIKNRNRLLRLLAGRVDFRDNTDAAAEHFPAVTERTIPVAMGDRQKLIYDAVMHKLPRSLRAKVRQLLPPTKQELKQLNAFLTAARQVSNNPAVYDTGATIEDASKIQAAVKNMAARLGSEAGSKGVVYSNYLDASLRPYKELLDRSGVPSAMITGDVPFKARKQSVDDYNAGRLRALLLSAAGGEGLDLKGTSLVQLLEPHWNDERLKQAMGRAIRYKSHEGLPPDKRKVDVERYLSVLPAKRTMFGGTKRPPSSVDEYLVDLSNRKTNLNAQFLDVLREASGMGVREA